MPGSEERNPDARWLWRAIAEERKRRNITRVGFARSLGIRRETLYRIEEGRTGTKTATLLDALERLGALGARPEIGKTNWHGAILSLSRHETESYDAIAKANGVTRGQAIRQLAAEGLLARRRPHAPGSPPEAER